MSIWEHPDSHHHPAHIRALIGLTECPYCRSTLRVLPATHVPCTVTSFSKQPPTKGDLRPCRCCGWWSVWKAWCPGFGLEVRYGSAGLLRDLDLGSLETPVSEVRAYLAAKYEARFSVHPRLFEETVGSVFRDLGYAAVVTGYSNDGGVDVILHDAQGRLIGVQVKRYRNTISVEQIRVLAGVLLIRGYAKGVFVTTSSFSRPGEEEARMAGRHGYPIELLNARRFFGLLKLAQREQYSGPDEFAASLGQIQLVYTEQLCGDMVLFAENQRSPGSA